MKHCCQNCRYAICDSNKQKLFCILNWWAPKAVEENYECGAFVEETYDDFVE